MKAHLLAGQLSSFVTCTMLHHEVVYCLVCAETARSGLGALPPSEAIYFLTTEDSQNRTLDASTGNNYTITFPLPLPAQAFWSLTLYNASNYLLVANYIDRYNIGDHVGLPKSFDS